MYKRVLLAYDGSAFEQLVLLSHAIEQWNRSELRLLAIRGAVPYVAAEGGYDGRYFESRTREEQVCETTLQDGIRWLRDLGYTVRGEVMVDGGVRKIAKYASDIAADLIVIHRCLGKSYPRWWHHLITGAFLENVHCNVLVVVTGERPERGDSASGARMLTCRTPRT